MPPSVKGKLAVVIGASVAGLLAARVLSDHFKQVIVVERDPHPDSPIPRKGAPQGYHAHALLKSGELALEALFPGLIEDLIQKDARQIDFSGDVKWFHFGHWKMRAETGFSVMIQSRPLVEQTIRQRLEALGNISFYYGYTVEDVIASDDKTRVTGIRIQKADERSIRQDLSADLVVDAGGRGSKTPQWLESLGYKRASETRVKIDLSYSSQVFEAPATRTDDWKLLVLNPDIPNNTRAGYIFPIENDQWLVTYGGYSGDKTPQTAETFVEYAQGLATLDVYEAIKGLKPVSDVKVFNVPTTVRHHYENLSRFPAGLIVMGDSFCAFDPVFGQGMSSAAKQAMTLQALLATDGYQNTAAFSQAFHKRVSGVISTPWLLATSEDFRYPKTEGKKAFFIPILHWYTGHIFALSATDTDVYNAFRSVMHLQSGPIALFKPGIVLKVLARAFGGKRNAQASSLEVAPESSPI